MATQPQAPAEWSSPPLYPGPTPHGPRRRRRLFQLSSNRSQTTAHQPGAQFTLRNTEFTAWVSDSPFSSLYVSHKYFFQAKTPPKQCWVPTREALPLFQTLPPLGLIPTLTYLPAAPLIKTTSFFSLVPLPQQQTRGTWTCPGRGSLTRPASFSRRGKVRGLAGHAMCLGLHNVTTGHWDPCSLQSPRPSLKDEVYVQVVI